MGFQVDMAATEEELEYLKVREQLKESFRNKLKKESGPVYMKKHSNDGYGSFFGPSVCVIAQRAIEESKSLQDVKHVALQMTKKYNLVAPETSLHLLNTKLKVQKIRETRDYSSLFSDDTGVSESEKVCKPAEKTELPSKMIAATLAKPSEKNSVSGEVLKKSQSVILKQKDKCSKPPKKTKVMQKNVPDKKNNVPFSKSQSAKRQHLEAPEGRKVPLQEDKYPQPKKAKVMQKTVPHKKNVVSFSKSQTAKGQHFEAPEGSKLQSTAKLHKKEINEDNKTKMTPKGLQTSSKSQKIPEATSSKLNHLSKQQKEPKKESQEHDKAKPMPKVQSTAKLNIKEIVHEDNYKAKMTPKGLKSSSKIQQIPNGHKVPSSKLSQLSKRPKEPKKRPRQEDSDEERGDYSSIIRKMFGYDPAKFKGKDDDDIAMESNFHDILKEERRSYRVARKEDEIERLRNEEEMRNEKLIRAKKRKLASNKYEST